MADNLKIERIDSSSIGKITRLHALCFENAKDERYFKWKYFDNPAGEALCLAAVRDGEAIGSCVMIPEEFSIFGKNLKIYKCCDLMVAPEYRRQGISTKLVISLIDYLRQAGPLFLYTLCGKNATPSFRKNKWQKLDSVGYYFKHKNQLKIKFLFSNFERLYDGGFLRQLDLAARPYKEYGFKEDLNRISVLRNERFLAWRLSNPYYHYSAIGYYENDNLKGYVIYNTGINDCLYILDLAVVNQDSEIIRALLSAAELTCFKTNCRMIIALTVRGTTFQAIIRKHNYLVNPFKNGPLSSRLDFNILIDAGFGKETRYKGNWNILPLNYDDI